ncbi:MAG: uroporphyrinogen-III C-methyltransferase [Peptoniphilaceae bacterium]|nr:uroporphyrinogen-III C-methyltransferase [Peptoniphilaceae bacterium]MDY3738556.1 uroporphyrinogen-III C-methyltransferase [Peptoniphilaceae bacterium]
MKKGIVKLVGAGIGPKDNLTIKAYNAINECDVLIYDRLLNSEIYENLLDRKECYYVGKTMGNHSMDQKKIEKLMVEKAKEGKNVVRLKGGDPYVFARGGEEAKFLYENNVDFEVVPGITSGIAALTYAGIPATIRKKVESLTFITGHKEKDKESDFSKYAKLKGTLVFYMALKNIKKIFQDLLKGGIDENMPCAVIYNGGYPNQEVLISTVKELSYKDIEYKSPAILVVGEVVKYRNKFNFYEKLPLFNKKIAVTRSKEQTKDLSYILENKGASVIELPSIEIKPVNENILKKLILNNNYTHIIFHSANTVKIFINELFKFADIRKLNGVKICCVGKKTAKVFKQYGIIADIVPDKYLGEELYDLIKNDKETKTKKILFPHSSLSDETLVDKYKENFDVDEFVIYENNRPKKMNEFEDFDYITFTSSSTVINFIKYYGICKLKDKICVSIGPTTTKTLQNYGIRKIIEAKKSTIEDIVDVIEENVYENEKN